MNIVIVMCLILSGILFAYFCAFGLLWFYMTIKEWWHK
jgi:hypothetical protein